MIITPKWDCVDGTIDTDKDKLVAIGSTKNAMVHLAVEATGSYVTFARIKLHSRDTMGEAKATYDDAWALGQEIARRWNAIAELERRADITYAEISSAVEELKGKEPEPIWMSKETWEKHYNLIHHERIPEQNEWKYNGRKISIVSKAAVHTCAAHRLLDNTCGVCGKQVAP